MIESFLTETCHISQRQDDTSDTWNDFDYTTSEEVDCRFMSKAGATVKTDKGEDVVISGYILLPNSVNIDEYDRIIYDDYLYEIIPDIAKRKGLISDDVSHYKVAVRRRRPHGEDDVSIKSNR